MKTKVINTTEDTLLIKEGTQGVFRRVQTLLPNKNCDIKVDSNSTYREYWCAAVDNDPNAMILSSDDCQDNRSVDIYKDGGKFRWRPSNSCKSSAPPKAVLTQASGSPEATTPSTTQVPTGEARKKGFFAVLWGKITGVSGAPPN